MIDSLIIQNTVNTLVSPTILTGFKPSVIQYLADASDWDGIGLPFGSTYLTNAIPSERPTLTDGRLPFTTNYSINSLDARLASIGQSGSLEAAIVYRPTTLATGYIFSWGTSLTDSDNILGLLDLSNGELRWSSDGNTGLNADSTQTSGLNMQVGSDYLITTTMIDWSVTLKVDGVTQFENQLIPIEDRPVGLSQFALGCRFGFTDSSFCKGDVTSLEIIAL